MPIWVANYILNILRVERVSEQEGGFNMIDNAFFFKQISPKDSFGDPCCNPRTSGVFISVQAHPTRRVEERTNGQRKKGKFAHLL
jgi:hypothetical protein